MKLIGGTFLSSAANPAGMAALFCALVARPALLACGNLLEEERMNWDQVEGKWKQVRGQLREKWGKLTDDDLNLIAGQREQLIGRLQERYGIAKEEAQERADEFVKSLTEESPSKKRAAHQS
jgi:uncharacterized protein YjbJ (UPF0337 family)